MSRLCPQCKRQFSAGDRYCSRCGEALGEPADQEQSLIAINDSGRSRETLIVAPHPATTSVITLPTSPATWSPALSRLGISQQRYITVLFTDLSGYTEAARQLENEVLYELMQQYINLLAKEIYKYEGVVDKLTGDGLMALFGVPIAQENNVERALRAALEMQAAVEAWSSKIAELFNVRLRMRIGVHAGPVIVGGISDLLSEYTAIGETVNLAQRIEVAASPGQILASQPVFEQANRLFDFEAVTNLKLRGFDQPVNGYRLMGLKSQTVTTPAFESLSAPFTGRRSELAGLDEVLQTMATEKRGRFVLISGEAGIGKSRLVQEFRKANHEPVQVVEAHSLTYRRSVSYWIFNDLIKKSLAIGPGLDPQADSRSLQDALHRRLGNAAQTWLPYLLHFCSLPMPPGSDTSKIDAMEPAELRRLTYEAIAALLLDGDQPRVFILEDLHWVDDASLELLRYLLELLPSHACLVLGVTRNVPSPGLDDLIEWAGSALGRDFLQIQLPRLDPHESQELLENLLHGADIESSLRRQLIEKSDGIPLYLEEVLRDLISNRQIDRRGERWVSLSSTDGRPGQAPISLQAIILSRYDQLPDEYKRTLQVAAVIGQHFDLDLMDEVLGAKDGANLASIIKRLVSEGFILADNPERKHAYTFRHVLFSEVIYNTLLKKDRNRLHGVVGQAIENLYPSRVMDHVELLARHFSWSAEFSKALHYLILAAQKAAANFANEAARKHFEHALALLPIADHSLEQALQVHVGLGDVYSATGEYASAKRHYQAAIQQISAGEVDEKYTGYCNAAREKIKIISSLFEPHPF